MIIAPHFGRYEEVLAGDHTFFEEVLKSLSDGGLVVIEISGVYVSVTSLDGGLDCFDHFFVCVELEG